MTDLPWPQRLKNALEGHLDEATIESIVGGGEGLETPEAKAQWTRGAIKQLDKLIPDEGTRIEVLGKCSCSCAIGATAELKAIYEKTGDIDAVLEASYRNLFYNKPRCEGSTVYITKVPAHQDEFQVAKTEQEKRRAFCHCEYVRAATDEISQTFCYCGAGWFKNIFEEILGRSVKVKFSKSILQGDDVCEVAIEI